MNYNTNMKYPDLSKEIIAMAEADQKMRKDSQSGKSTFDKNIDENNSTRLKQILKEINGWPTISSVGEEASYAAWLIAQHADHNVNFQEECLKLILKSNNDVLPANIAYLTDRVAVNRGRQQTYGTQFYQNKKGEPTPRPIKDNKMLDNKRKKMGLEPFTVYEQKMKGNYIWPKGYINPKIGRFDKSP